MWHSPFLHIFEAMVALSLHGMGPYLLHFLSLGRVGVALSIVLTLGAMVVLLSARSPRIRPVIIKFAAFWAPNASVRVSLSLYLSSEAMVVLSPHYLGPCLSYFLRGCQCSTLNRYLQWICSVPTDWTRIKYTLYPLCIECKCTT